MYGDCHVTSTMAGSSNDNNPLIPPDALFPNPNFGFMGNMTFNSFSTLVPKEEEGGGGMMMMMGSKMEEELSGSGSGGHMDGISCGEENEKDDMGQRGNGPGGKRKRYHRHSAHQIQEMEAVFKECPHPDDKLRIKLSQELGLKPRQVKFWFQNKRTQMKAQQDRTDNAILSAENENLKNENYRLQAALRSLMCPNCGGPGILGEMSYDEQQLRHENARLKDQLEQMSCFISRYPDQVQLQSLPVPTQSLMVPSLELDMNTYSRHFSDQQQAMEVCNNMAPVQNSILIMDQGKGLALDLAFTASEHLLKLCTMNEPLWVSGNGGIVNEVLDYEEYITLFSWPVELKQQGEGIRIEVTRDSGIVMMNSITLVDAFFNTNKWMELFPTIVSKAKTLQIVAEGISSHGNGSLHLMFAEFQVLSPLVPPREAYFLRYSQQNVDEGTWLIVDFPIDGFHGLDMSMTRYRRRPSGCIIRDMPNGYAKVTWVEHGDVQDTQVHQIFDKLVNSGVAFGATRWLSLLQRQCERHASLMAQNIPDLGVIPSPEGRKNMMNLSQRMIRTFCANISSSNNQSWTALSESSDDTIRVTTRKNTEPGQPNGVILTAVSTVWLPFSHSQVFELLSDEQKRTQLDALSYGNSLHEVAHIANGSHQRNCISLMRINAPSNSSQNVELLLQESSTHDVGGSIVVYATVDVDAVQIMMSGQDPSYVPLLPTGFVVLPAPPSDPTVVGSASGIGCLLTVAMQVLASSIPSAKLSLSSISSINTQLSSVVQQITNVLISTTTASSNNNNNDSNNNDDGLNA